MSNEQECRIRRQAVFNKVRANLLHTPPYSSPLSYPPPSRSLVPPRSQRGPTGQPELITRDDSKCEKINQIIHFHSEPLMLPDPSHECQLLTITRNDSKNVAKIIEWSVLQVKAKIIEWSVLQKYHINLISITCIHQ